MRIYFDTGVWIALARDPEGIKKLQHLVRRREDQLLLSPTTLGELHGIGPGHQDLYDAADHAVRCLGWNRIARDAQELVTIAFVRFAAKLLGGEFAREASHIDGSFFTADKLSEIPRFKYNPALKKDLDERKARNLESVKRLRDAVAADTDGAMRKRVELFRKTVLTPNATSVLEKLARLPNEGKLCPFVLSHRDGYADLETTIRASDTLLLHTIVGDLKELPALPVEPWDHAASLLLRKHAASFDDSFWKNAPNVNDDPYLFRQRTMNFMHLYLIANGFARDNGSFWFDGQNVVYAHDVHLFATTDARTAKGLRSEYMRVHHMNFGKSPGIHHFPPDSDVAGALSALLSRAGLRPDK